MATISTPNDPNRTATTANAGPQQSQQMSQSTSGAPTSSGKFSTLQKYLGANQGAGQRIAGMVGGNLSQEQQRMKDTTSRELDESGQANQQFGQLTKDTQGFTQKLSTPAQGPIQSTTGPGYDVNSYQANLSGQQAAKDIAKDQNQLQQFTGIRTGDLTQQKQQESEKQANEAVQAASKAYDTNKQRQSQLQNNQGRDQLLSQILNTKTQRAGVRNLDNAFLTQDKTRALNNVTDSLRQDVGNLRSSIDSGKMSASEIANLRKSQDEAQGGLLGRLQAMQDEYNTLLGSRVTDVNAAKDVRKTGYLSEFDKLKRNEAISEGFAKDIGLDRVMAADPNRLPSGGGEMNALGMPSMSGIRLFNELNNKNLENVLNTEVLDRRAMGLGDVVNKADIENLNSLAALAGIDNQYQKESDFTGRQVSALDLADKLNTRADKFQTEDLSKGFQGAGGAEEGVYRDSWTGRRQTGTARANSSAAASLDDFLSGNIYRNTGANETQSNGFLDRVLRDPREILGGILDLPAAILQPKGFESDSAEALDSKSKLDLINENLNTRRQSLANAGYTTSGGLAGRDHGWNQGEQERVASTAEARAVNAVNQQAQDYINSIGYNNLVKIAKGDF